MMIYVLKKTLLKELILSRTSVKLILFKFIILLVCM